MEKKPRFNISLALHIPLTHYQTTNNQITGRKVRVIPGWPTLQPPDHETKSLILSDCSMLSLFLLLTHPSEPEKHP